MKTRTGFVSNSSSSSFVLEVGKPFNTPLEVAKYMVPKRESDNDADLVKKIERTIQKCPDLTPVCFKSCNYDTFIVKMDKYFLVQTCHNHNWDIEQWRVSAPAEYYSYYGDDSFFDIPSGFEFFHLDYDVKGKVADWNDTRGGNSFCDKCYNDFWWIGDALKCPKCGESFEEQKKRKKNENT